MSKLEKEILDIKISGEKQAIESMKPILKSYKRSLDDVKSEISKIYMEYTVDNELKIGKQQRLAVLKELEKKLVLQAKELGATDVEVTSNILSDAYKDAYYQAAYTIDKGVTTNIDFTILNKEMVKAAVEMPIENVMFSDRIWKNKELLVNRIRQDVEKALIQGESVEKLARKIKNTFGSSAYESKRLLQTEVARCQTQSFNNIYKDSGIVKKVMWSSTLDTKTNPEDAQLDGKIWGIDEKHSEPPLHPNCRCCLIAVIDEWSPSERRDNSTGEVIPYKTYEEWAKDLVVK